MYSSINLNCFKLAVAVLLLLILAAGCDDDPVSPCNGGVSVGCDGKYTSVTNWSFDAGPAVLVTVDGFVGQVIWRPGRSGKISVRVTRRAERAADLSCIDVEMAAFNQGLDITTSNPGDRDNVSVDLEITAPPDARAEIRVGVGNIDYQGRPSGISRFTTGVGNVILRLPADINLSVDLSAAIGSVVLGFPVNGSVRVGWVKGTIGTGADGEVVATTAVGTVQLVRQ